MVHTILPVVHGRSHEHSKNDRRLAAIFLAAMIGSSTTVGFLVSIIATPIRESSWSDGQIRAVVLFFGAFVLALDVLKLTPIELPGSSWQAPRHWILSFPPALWHALFGSYIGVGFITKMPIRTPYLLLLIATQLPPPIAAIVLGSFGLVRGSVILAMSGVHQVRQDLMLRITEPPGHLVPLNGAVLGTVAGCFLATITA